MVGEENSQRQAKEARNKKRRRRMKMDCEFVLQNYAKSMGRNVV
jgi:hypothetical protein